MNNKTAIGLVAAIILLALAFLFLHTPAAAPVLTGSTGATTTAPVATSTVPATKPATEKGTGAPSMSMGTPVPVRVAAFDQSSLTSSLPRPIITGTANVSAVAMVLDDPQGVGIAGTNSIPVINGHWSWSAPQMLQPGTYTLHLIGGSKQIDAKLVVTQ